MVMNVWFDRAKLRLLDIAETLCQGLTNYFGKTVLIIIVLCVLITNFFGRITNGKPLFVARIPVDLLVFGVVIHV